MMSSSSESLKKTSRTYLLKKSAASSMELPLPLRLPLPLPLTSSNPPTINVPRKYASIEFPTSPNAGLGEEILHSSHPHPLAHVSLPDLFTCTGCREYGAGSRFACRQCDFQLHDFCASVPPALKAHPLHAQHQLLFYSKSVKGGILRSKCDVCGKPIKGYNFQCSACSFQMHPCCAMLSAEMNFLVHPHTLKLLPAMALASGDPAGFSCGECNRKRSGRVYSCTVCDYHLHAVCAKNMINGLHANGFKGLEKPSMFGTAARLASQVVIEFLGGLIEGIGEGVGEVFIQNMARGRCHSTRID